MVSANTAQESTALGRGAGTSAPQTEDVGTSAPPNTRCRRLVTIVDCTLLCFLYVHIYLCVHGFLPGPGQRRRPYQLRQT